MKHFNTLLCTLLMGTSSLTAWAQLPSAAKIAPEMYPGWNLGNTFEACPCTWLSNDLDWETGWQATRTTQEVIDFVQAQGFRSVRIPVAWYTGHLDDQATLHIREAWLERVREVVDYCINDGLYVVLNDHWDGGWLENHIKGYDPGRAQTLRTLWTQIAEEFRDYDEHLLFAGLNEPNADDQASTNDLMRYHQDFVDAVRATGGNNATRTLVVQGPNTDIDKTCSYLSHLPQDAAQGRMMVEVHYYSPYNFCMMTKDEGWGNQAYFWGTDNHVTDATYQQWNATWGEEGYLRDEMQLLYGKFGTQGIPVIIGEYGAIWRTVGGGYQADHDASIRLYHKLVNQEAISHGCIPFVWDTNGCGQNSMDVLNRASLTVFNPHALQGIQAGVAAAAWPESMSCIEGISQEPATRCCYNLMGQRVADLQSHGLVIRNGTILLMR